MTEGLIATTTLPPSLSKFFQSSLIKFQQEPGKVQLIEINDTTSKCPLTGILDIPTLTVETLLAERQKERENENIYIC